jgi:hypothetical protein
MGGTLPTPSFDERGTGFVRVYNATGLPMAQIDMGAHERQPTPLFADYNGDDVVNSADYTVWRNTLGSTLDLRADGDRNLVVDHNDYLYWKARYGQTPEIGSGSVLASGQLTVEPVSDSSPVAMEASAPSSGESQATPAVFSTSFIGLGPAAAPIGRVVSQLVPPAAGGAGDDAQDDALLALSAIPAGSTPLRSGDATAQAEDESSADDSAAGENDPLDAAFAELGAGGL